MKRRDLRTLYSPKASRVLRVLLNEPRRAWQVQQLAKEAQVSLGLASSVKKLLVDREWMRSEADGLRLVDPGALLEEWARSYSFRKSRLVDCYTLRDVAEAEAALAEGCTKRGWDFALTGFSGAPYSTSI